MGIDERMVSILERFAKEEEAAVEKTMLEQADRGGRQGARQGRKKQEEDENNQREKERQLRRRKYEKQRAEAEKRISEEFKDVSSEEEPELYFKADAAHRHVHRAGRKKSIFNPKFARDGTAVGRDRAEFRIQ